MDGLWPSARAVGILDTTKSGIQDPWLARTVFYQCDAEAHNSTGGQKGRRGKVSQLLSLPAQQKTPSTHPKLSISLRLLSSS